MSDVEFGRQLRIFRQQCQDPLNGRALSQQRLGALLGEELGIGFSGAAISDWERSKSKIHVDDRLLLINLLKALNKTGGLRTALDANILLEAGNYRALNESEREQVFPRDEQAGVRQSPVIDAAQQQSLPKSFPKNIFWGIVDGFQTLIDEAQEGPRPVWPRIVTAILRQISDQISPRVTIRTLLWLWVWIVGYLTVIPVLQWPFPNQQIAGASTIKFICASIFLPICVGLLTNTRENPFWLHNTSAPPRMIRLYTYQGSFTGFHVGYCGIFVIYYLMFFFHLGRTAWFEFILAGFPLAMSYVGAHVIPYNLWRAYGRLWFSDGAIFFVFIPLGPIWAWFFLKFYSVLIPQITSIIVTLVTISLLAILTARFFVNMIRTKI